MVLVRVVEVGVDAAAERHVDVLSGCGQQDLAGARVAVLLQRIAGAEVARGLDHDVGTELLPWELGRFPLLRHAERVAVERQPTRDRFDRAWIAAVDAVVGKQVRQGVGVTQVVDADDVSRPSPARPG